MTKDKYMKKFLLGVAIIIGMTFATQAHAQFTCDTTMYLSQSPALLTGATLYQVNRNVTPYTYTAIGTNAHGINYNATAYNPVDNFLYGLNRDAGLGDQLYRIDETGAVTLVGAVAGLPAASAPVAGYIDSAGNYYVYYLGVSTLYTVNTVALTSTSIALSGNPDLSDMVYDNGTGLLYGVNATSNILQSINPTTGIVSLIGAGTTAPSGSFGAMFLFGDGVIYGNNNTGGFYVFDKTTGVATLISSSGGATFNDGANCPTAGAPSFDTDLSVTQTASTPGPLNPGDTVTYTITVTNNGPANITGGTVTTTITSGLNPTWTCIATGTAVCSASGSGALSDTVSVPVGESLTYTVTVTIPSNYSTTPIVQTTTSVTPTGYTDTNSADNSVSTSLVYNRPRSSSGGGSVPDKCKNIPGLQITVPEGYVRTGSDCTEDKPVIPETPTVPKTPENTIPTYVSPIDGSVQACMPFTKYLKIHRPENDQNEVKLWQSFLNKYNGEKLPITGYYGQMTYDAITRFQTKYKADVLEPWGLDHPTGYTYKSTRAKGNQVLGCPEGEVTLDNGGKINLK